MQTQMLTAPSAFMAEQTPSGFVEHPEESLTVDVANPDYRHTLWIPGNPPFGAFLEDFDVPRGEVQSRRLVEVRGRLSDVKRRSAARISTSSPRTRHRASGRSGSARVPSTT